MPLKSGGAVDNQYLRGRVNFGMGSVEKLANIGAYISYKMSTVRVTTTSGTPVDDVEASLTLTLAFDCQVIIVYNASSMQGKTEIHRGKHGLISIDGVDNTKTRADQSPYLANCANSFTCVFVGELLAGSHTIKGRFASNLAGDYVGIDTRQLIMIAIPKIYQGTITGIMSGLRVSTTSTTLVDDAEALLSSTLLSNMESIIIYNASSKWGSIENRFGKHGLINIDATDQLESQADQSCYGDDAANSFTSMHTQLLSAGPHTFKGKFASESGLTVGIDNRQLALLAVPLQFPIFRKTSKLTTSTTSINFVDDTEAKITFNLVQDSLIIVIYNASSKYLSEELTDFGKKGLINVDGVDKSESRADQAPFSLYYPNSFTSCFAGTLTAGAHTIQGRFASNEAGYKVVIDQRELVVLVIPNQYLL